MRYFDIQVAHTREWHRKIYQIVLYVCTVYPIKFSYYTIRMFPPAIDIIPTLLAVVYSDGKYAK